MKRPRGEPAPGLIDMYPGMVMANSLRMNADAAQAAEANAEERHRERHEAADREAAQLREELKAARAAAADGEHANAAIAVAVVVERDPEARTGSHRSIMTDDSRPSNPPAT